jgi:hypothetical protein
MHADCRQTIKTHPGKYERLTPAIGAGQQGFLPNVNRYSNFARAFFASLAPVPATPKPAQ